MDDEQDYSAVRAAATRFEMIASWERALDLSYRRLRRAARAEWERRFAAEKDPCDACVSVRVNETATAARAVRGSGFLKTQKPSEPNRKLPLPRLAR
jgi:hypothetical protein